jgi:hypothetical protein
MNKKEKILEEPLPPTGKCGRCGERPVFNTDFCTICEPPEASPESQMVEKATEWLEQNPVWYCGNKLYAQDYAKHFAFFALSVLAPVQAELEAQKEYRFQNLDAFNQSQARVKKLTAERDNYKLAVKTHEDCNRTLNVALTEARTELDKLKIQLLEAGI